MATYQIDLDKLVESKETYKSSATELEEYMERSRSAIQAVDREAYDGQDADALRDLFLAYIAGRFNETQQMAQKVTQKLSTACITGKLSKMRCYNFICAFEGAGRQDLDNFGGKLYCDQEQIMLLKSESMNAMDHGQRLRNSAAEVEQMLSGLKIVQVNSGEYVTRINEGCAEVDRLEDYSICLTDYARLVEEMDVNLQGDLRECIQTKYEMTADGIEGGQKYPDMELDIEELERLLNIPDEELSDADRVKRDALLVSYEKMEAIINMVNTAKQEFQDGVAEVGKTNKVKYNTWYYREEVSGDDYPWCAVFVIWCANEAGLLDGEVLPDLNTVRENYFEGVRNIKKWYSNNGRFHEYVIGDSGADEAEYIPKLGDFVVFYSKKNGDHIGIVAGYDEETHTLYTYEGNSGNEVRANVYKEIDINNEDYGIVGYCSNGSNLIIIPENSETFADNTGGSTR